MFKYSRSGQRFGGFFLTALDGVALGWMWQHAITKCEYWPKAAAFFGSFLVLGIGLIIFPIDHAYLEAKYNVGAIKFQHFPWIWKMLTVLAILFGIANWIALENLGSFVELAC
jgi:hypothetical protein